MHTLHGRTSGIQAIRHGAECPGSRTTEGVAVPLVEGTFQSIIPRTTLHQRTSMDSLTAVRSLPSISTSVKEGTQMISRPSISR